MELLLIRHAESQYNAKETDHLDSALTKLGRKQTIDVSAFLKRKFDDIQEWDGLVSPFLRTLQTAKTIYEHTDLKFKVDWRIHEYGGDYACMTSFDIPNRKDKFPEFFEDTEVNSWKMIAEVKSDFFDRILKFVEWLQEYNGRYVIVSHAIPIYTMIYILKGIYRMPKWDRRILNTSVTWIWNNEIRYFARYVNSGKDPRPDGKEITLI